VFHKHLWGREGAVPQGLKPAFFKVLNGTAEAVPFPKPIHETRYRNFRGRERNTTPKLSEEFGDALFENDDAIEDASRLGFLLEQL